MQLGVCSQYHIHYIPNLKLLMPKVEFVLYLCVLAVLSFPSCLVAMK
jgi:hypothetical protein